MWWIWALGSWVVVAIGLALVLGPAFRMAEHRDRRRVQPGTTAGVPTRQRLPVPAFAIVLTLIGVGLAAGGFLLQTAGLRNPVLGLDGALALPHIFVTLLFLATAVAGVYGALRLPERRAWWLAVAAAAAGIGTLQADDGLQARVLAAFGVEGRPALTAAVSVAATGLVLAGLFLTTRTERRDRRRVLVGIGRYALVAIGTTALASAVPAGGWQDAVAFLAAAGESGTAVFVLVAVLAGVAPRLVVPDSWVLRRTADAQVAELYPVQDIEWGPVTG